MYLCERLFYIQKIATTFTHCILCYIIIAVLVLYENSRYVYTTKCYIIIALLLLYKKKFVCKKSIYKRDSL